MNRVGFAERQRPPVVLTVPGLNNSGPDHWQTLWEQSRGDCERVDLGRWANPNRNAWVTRLDARCWWPRPIATAPKRPT